MVDRLAANQLLVSQQARPTICQPILQDRPRLPSLDSRLPFCLRSTVTAALALLDLLA